jgi:hypothetical protein
MPGDWNGIVVSLLLKMSLMNADVMIYFAKLCELNSNV